HLSLAEMLAQRLDEQLEALAAARGQAHGAYATELVADRAGQLAVDVDLVVHEQLRYALGTDLLENAVDVPDTFVAQWIREVDHLDEQRGVAHFLERRAERRHQLVRQVAHEADRVCEDDVETRREAETAQRGI